MNQEPSAAFLSDNAAPAHPAALDALFEVNTGTMPSYGEDPVTARAADAIRRAFESPTADVLFALTGTAANIIALAGAVQPWDLIICSDIAHIVVDEAGGVGRLSGATVMALPSRDGLLDPGQLDTLMAARGVVHQSQPRIVSITQCTEHGRVWTSQAITEFVDHAHELGLLVHVDGARIGNAVAALEVSPLAATGDADIVSVGGTKNGMLFGDAILVRRPDQFRGIRFVQKQIGHLGSKHRYVSAQFDAMFRADRWLESATHANEMAARLSSGLTELGHRLSWPTEANEVFVDLTDDDYDRLSRSYLLERPVPSAPPVRFVCSWSTTVDEVDAVLTTLAAP